MYITDILYGHIENMHCFENFHRHPLSQDEGTTTRGPNQSTVLDI